MIERPISFSYWLRRRRKALDWTQAELAARAGCVVTTIKKIETGARQPSRRLAERLADALALADDARAAFLDAAGLRAAAPSTLPAVPATALGLETPLTALPAPAGPLFGRSREIAALRSLLTDAETRLVTLTGIGGVGKTSLALRVAADLRDVFIDGVWYVDLAPINNAELVAAVIARTLGLEPGAMPLAALVRMLRDQQTLLVLDNFEQVAGAAPVVAQLLAAAHSLTMLVTSRTPLRLASEQEYFVPALELPPQQGAHALDTYAAVQLFVRRARAVQPDFTLSAENGATVAEICRRLDGLPLAIELAAVRVRLLPPPALLRRLDRRLALLTDGPRDLPARQQTLRATLDWSYRLLGARAQRIFARLGVFVGGATLEAIEVVCGETERGDDLPALLALVEHSLLRRSEDRDGEPRFFMLETVREYALYQLGTSSEEAAVRARHARYALALAEAAVSHLRAAEQVRWLDWLEAEHDNMRAAFEWFLGSHKPEEALRLAAALHWFWDRRGYLSEGRARLRTALDAANALITNETMARTRAWALVGAAALAFDQGDRAAVAALAEKAVDLFQTLDDDAGLSLALLRLAFARGMTDPRGAQGMLAEARARAAATGAPWFVGLAHFVSAQAALFGAGDPIAARELIEPALTALHASGDPYLIAHGLATLGLIDLAKGDLSGARAALENGLAAARPLRDTRSVALIAASTADVARCQGDYARAASLYGESLALYHELGNTVEIPAILHNQGYVALGEGAGGAARHLFLESLRRQQTLENPAGIAEALAGLAAVAVAQKQPQRAAQLFGAAEAVRLIHAAPVWPAERFEVERNLALARASLSGPVFEEHWRAGRALSPEQAIAYARAPEPASSVQPPHRRPGGLTSREHEVALLVAQGRSNRLIAETLVISERTAEHHVANILAKLDFTSRAQIAAWVVTAELAPASI